MFWLAITIVAFVMFSYLVLRGENLSYLDQPVPQHSYRAPSDAMRSVLASLSEFGEGSHGRGRQRIHAIRGFMDKMGAEGTYESEFLSLSTPDLRGEWVLGPNHDSGRRILYLHGGAFIAGSPLSHRAITDRLARLTGASVFALDYRLMPEHKRIEGIEDCRRAYRWILENGPDGRSAAETLVVAGDSAGGNLTLSLLAWVRDQGLRQADAGIALSPATDAVLDAPSLRDNIATDPMLGPAFGALAKVPNIFVLWYTWATSRMLPTDPRISPLRGSLADLPPVLVQASDTEMLLDDARRYVAKAQAAESPVVLQTWPDMVHVWQMFTPELEEAEEAFANIAEFLDSVVPTSVEQAA
ncbi:alpha/beta hydrolase [Congregibacter brevis]|uniref:Alpha/beta hydrolase n=1 Tax=Congregibacter brevis TaxID=3081201 RepID=A0ABZ0IAB4_9GAMM|nr:alpha/beta hydrolase [Congregibacter sp. IMCC45268]